MQNRIIEKVEASQARKGVPKIRVGDRVSVSVRLKEGDKERIQVFRGIILQMCPKSGKGPRATFTVRKVSQGVGVERIFPLHSPFIEKIEVETSSQVRQSRLFYLRQLQGKKARLKEMDRFPDAISAETADASEAAPNA